MTTPQINHTKIISPHIAKHLSKTGDWCGCCGSTLPEGVSVIVFKTAEGNYHITEQHMRQFIDCPETDRLYFKKQRKKYSLE